MTLSPIFTLTPILPEHRIVASSLQPAILVSLLILPSSSALQLLPSFLSPLPYSFFILSDAPLASLTLAPFILSTPIFHCLFFFINIHLSHSLFVLLPFHFYPSFLIPFTNNQLTHTLNLPKPLLLCLTRLLSSPLIHDQEGTIAFISMVLPQ